jgi:hypothetical protein
MSVLDMHGDGARPPGCGTRRFLRSKRTVIAALAAVALTLGLTLPLAATAAASPGPVGNNSGFEDDDGNLAVNSTFDWNGFAPTTWTGTAPYRTSDKTASGWHFGGFEDAQNTGTDSAFAGGVKQDNNCAATTTAKASNKDDLKRIYLASKSVPVSGQLHTFLNLAWVRIPQNTTSPSAHVAFEFNKGTTPCPAPNPFSLVQRTAGDMLIVYDFEGGSTDAPTLTLRRWVTAGACEISNDSPPCWGTATNLTASGFAEGKVNTSGSVLDTIGPSSPENLGTSEFGEAGVDLTAAGVFNPNQCEAFGKASGVSRSSGNSGTAQMKDLVGPGNFRLANCGEIIIKKHTDPRGLDQNFSFTSDIQTSPATDNSTFTLNDHGNTTGDSADNTKDIKNVLAGTYTVEEGADPAGFTFESLECTATGTGTSVDPTSSTTDKSASITMAGDGLVTCVYTNQQQLGAIKITKTGKNKAAGEGDQPLSGADFSITGPNGFSKSVTTGADGTVCVDSLTFGDYTVTETKPPAGYQADDSTGHTVTVDNNATCADNPYGGEAISFTDTPLTDISANATSQKPGATNSTIICKDANGNTVADSGALGDPANASAKGLTPGTYTCTITIDP